MELNEILFDLYVSYACRALLGGGKGRYIMDGLKEENPQLYFAVMNKAREKLNASKMECLKG